MRGMVVLDGVGKKRNDSLFFTENGNFLKKKEGKKELKEETKIKNIKIKIDKHNHERPKKMSLVCCINNKNEAKAHFNAIYKGKIEIIY